MLLIVMYESRTWHVRPGESFTFGRDQGCSAALPEADRGVSRHAGSFACRGRSWWLRNDSSSAVLCLLGDRGLRVDLPPGLQVPLQQWQAKVIISGALGRYTLRLRLPDLDDVPVPGLQPPEPGERAVTSTRYRAPLNDDDRLVLAARFEPYLARRTAGIPHRAAPGRPRSGSAGRRTPWRSGARTSGTATCGWAFRGCAARGHWKSWHNCWSLPAS